MTEEAACADDGMDDMRAQGRPRDQGDALAQVVIPAKAGSQDDVGPRQRHAGMTGQFKHRIQ